MARLIDADDLIKEINKKMPQGSARGVFKAFIDEQPTAYNVEKVVAELEDKSQYCIPINGQAFTGIKTEYAIDIVKRGGVDERT